MMSSCIAMAVFGVCPHQVSSPFGISILVFIGFKGIVFSGFAAVVAKNRFCIRVRDRMISTSGRVDYDNLECVLRAMRIVIDKAPRFSVSRFD